MPNYNNIPILRDARLMMVEVERIVKGFPRYYKHTKQKQVTKKRILAMQKLQPMVKNNCFISLVGIFVPLAIIKN
jgi:hypothetical protein